MHFRRPEGRHSHRLRVGQRLMLDCPQPSFAGMISKVEWTPFAHPHHQQSLRGTLVGDVAVSVGRTFLSARSAPYSGDAQEIDPTTTSRLSRETWWENRYISMGRTFLTSARSSRSTLGNDLPVAN